MNDEQIAEYLRSRARVRPPIDLVGSIADAVAGVPQQRPSWFAPFAPAAGAVAAAAVVLLAAVLVGQDRGSEPPSAGSPTQVETTVPSAQPTPTATPAPTLLEPGDTITLDAVDADGPWGEITLTRGDDLGGYDDGSVPPESFVIEIQVEYVAEREPDPLEFGRQDWRLVTRDGESVGSTLPFSGRRERERPSLSTYPGAIDIFSNPLVGWLKFEVSRSVEGEPLDLIYRPAGQSEPVATIPVRQPGPAPDPVALATPAPTPMPVSYVEKEGYPFTVIESAEADELFEAPDTCTNPEAGYTVTYPDAWFTNTEIGDWPACSWFSPVFYDVGEDPNEVPPEVAIVIRFGEFGRGWAGGGPDFSLNEEIAIAGLDATRDEVVGFFHEGGDYEALPAIYTYHFIVTSQPAETTITATTQFENAANYELNKAVLDRIMALIEFEE